VFLITGYALRCRQQVTVYEKLFHPLPVDVVNIEPYSRPSPCAEIGWYEVAIGFFTGQRVVHARRCSTVQGDSTISVMVVDKPREPFATHLQGKMECALHGEVGRLGQLLADGDYPGR